MAEAIKKVWGCLLLLGLSCSCYCLTGLAWPGDVLVVRRVDRIDGRRLTNHPCPRTR